MKVLILTSSPNADGLTAACGRSAAQGVKAAGHQAEALNLCKQQLNSCRACGNGWGACRAGQVCTGVQDDFSQIQQRAREADALVLVTPVYYGQMSERMKAFCDRLRRCDALREGKGAFQGKPVLLVAAAGGSGGGTLSCLTEMLAFTQHLGMRYFDVIPVTQRTRAYQLEAIQAAGSALTAY